MSPENVRDNQQSARKVIIAKGKCPAGIQRNIFGARIVAGGTVYRSIDIGNPAVSAGIDPMGIRTRNNQIGRSGNRMHLKI